MTTRTLTVQADRRAYVSHMICVVKISTFCCQKTVLRGLHNTAAGARSDELLLYHFRVFPLFTIWKH